MFKSPHSSGPLIPDCGDPQYECCLFPKFKLTNSEPNNCCGVSCGKIVRIYNFVYCLTRQSLVVIGRKFESQSSFYDKPCDLSLLGIFKMKSLSELKSWKVEEVTRKYFEVCHDGVSIALCFIQCKRSDYIKFVLLILVLYITTYIRKL